MYNMHNEYFKKLILFHRVYLGKNDPKYADALLDFGFYLLNVDSIVQSVEVYKVSMNVATCLDSIYLFVAKLYQTLHMIDGDNYISFTTVRIRSVRW